ncbi:hypothetical protein D3C81_727300 [compost metagenome]
MSLTLVKASEKIAMATTHIEVKGGLVEVLVVGPRTGDDIQGLADAGRYYLSPTIANTAFDDLDQGREHTPVFEGRSQAEMLSYLVKNAK